MMYLLLLAADALFALQFVFERKFRILQGDGLPATLLAMIYSSLFKVVILLMIGGFQVEFSFFSLGVTLVFAIICILSNYASLKALAISLVWYLLKFRKLPVVSAPTVWTQGGWALCNGIGDLFLLIALTVLPASVQYPIVTGGTMIFSALLGLCLKEKLTKKKALSLLAAVVATILVIL